MQGAVDRELKQGFAYLCWQHALSGTSRNSGATDDRRNERCCTVGEQETNEDIRD